jgi:hypothetical protein
MTQTFNSRVSMWIKINIKYMINQLIKIIQKLILIIIHKKILEVNHNNMLYLKDFLTNKIPSKILFNFLSWNFKLYISLVQKLKI